MNKSQSAPKPSYSLFPLSFHHHWTFNIKLTKNLNGLVVSCFGRSCIFILLWRMRCFNRQIVCSMSQVQTLFRKATQIHRKIHCRGKARCKKWWIVSIFQPFSFCISKYNQNDFLILKDQHTQMLALYRLHESLGALKEKASSLSPSSVYVHYDINKFGML